MVDSEHSFGMLHSMNVRIRGTDMEEKLTYKSQFIELDDNPALTKCLLCEEGYTLPTNEKEFLTHLFQEHRLVIGDVWKISSLKSYIHYWRVKFKDELLITFCTTLLMDCKPNGEPSKNESYFLLSDCLLEDKTLRDEIHHAKLEWVLSEQSKERADTNFKRGCIFCRMEFTGSRTMYIKHLSEKHNLYLGKPENLVFLDEFLDKIQSTIESLICIYCEKVFKDRVALKEHMRKKLHKRVNPTNKEYDKFYINNYLEPGNTRVQHQSISAEEECVDDATENDNDELWSDWNDDEATVTCLFCKHNDKQYLSLLHHMKIDHDFDFESASLDLTFYEKVKVVNYIKKQMLSSRCILCEKQDSDVLKHMEKEQHFQVPAKKVWDQPQFYFPLSENDSFLYNLDTNSSDGEDGNADFQSATSQPAKN